jgi:hypothetical protein
LRLGEYTLQEFIMAMEQAEQRAPDDKSEASLDDAVEDSFPASAPPSTGAMTRIGPSHEAPNGSAEDSDVPEPDPNEDIADKETPADPSLGDVPPDEAPPQGDLA